MTQWTQEQYQELSRKVAEKFKLPEYSGTIDDAGFVQAEVGQSYTGYWLHNDWHEIMQLCVKHGVYCTAHFKGKANFVMVYFKHKGLSVCKEIHHADHNNNPSLAERVARMLALMEV